MSRLTVRSVPRPALPAHRVVALTLAALAASAATPTFAAKIYRCGNAFQDQPCPEVKIAAALPTDRGIVVIRDTSCATPSRDNPGRGDCGGKAPAPREMAADAKR